jgi:signal peptidase I
VAKETVAVADFRKSVAREYLESIVVALMLALFIRTFIVQAFKIPSSSMESNLLIGDHLLVNKLVYSPSWGDVEDRFLAKREIRRGHIVIFKYPKDPERDFIKRVIGLPGEVVEVRDKVVYVDGQPLREPYTQFIEPLIRRDDPAYGPREDGRDNWGPHRVPDGKLFVMGDNRDNSSDGRFWGYLPRDQVKGRALMVYWSYDATKGGEGRRPAVWAWVTGVLSAPFHTRWGRFFHVIR